MSISERPPESSSVPPSVPSNSFVNAPYWLIVGGVAQGDSSQGSRSRRAATVEVLSLDLADGGAEGRVLPVFGSEERAAQFARAWNANAAVTDPVGGKPERARASTEGVGSDWRSRGTGAGELISFLSGSAFSAAPCGGVERVIIDPSAELVDGMKHGLTEGHAGALISMGRACFLERLMGRGRPWFENRDRAEDL